ncbi:MAG: succinate dehydrogenase cytochrome b subunit [Candidatus Omnitrophica bacterium]|nr:succinate dehydrogenase cytochrome b subunit [Candidatus Omnitrophota bacterium]
MKQIIRVLKSSVGKKYLMAVTGLALCGFLVAHLIGNLFLYKGPGGDAYNAYGHKLESLGPLLKLAELGLLALFLVHIVLAIVVSIENKRARGAGYASYKGKGGSTLASRVMAYTGGLVGVFVVLHLLHFKFAEHLYDAKGYVDWYTMVLQLFQKPVFFAFYVASVLILGFHLYHAVQSCMRSLGLDNDNYDPLVQWVSRIFSGLMVIGFSSIPIWAFFLKG